MNTLLLEAAHLYAPPALPLYEYRAELRNLDPCGRRAGFRCVGAIRLAGQWERPRRGPDRPDFLVYDEAGAPQLAVESKINNSIQAHEVARYERRVQSGEWKRLVFLSHLGTPDDKRVALRAGELYRFLLWEDVLAFISESPLLAHIERRIASEVARIAHEPWLGEHLERQSREGRLPRWWDTHRDRAAHLEYYIHGIKEFAHELGLSNKRGS